MNRVISFYALLVDSEAEIDLESDLASKEVSMSLQVDRVEKYFQYPKNKELTKLITTQGETYYIDEEWHFFDLRFKEASGQKPDETWQAYHSNDGMTTIRTYNN